MAMNEMDMGEMMPDESIQSIEMEKMESEPQQDPIEMLKQDHRKVEALFEQFEGTEDKRQKLEFAKQICMELTIHATVEEKLVYPLLKQEDEDTEEEAELEHELVKFMISQIEGSRATDKTLKPKVKVLKELVQHHVEEEEEEALPELEGNEELKSRAGEMLALKQELMQKLIKGGKSRGGRKSAASSRGGSKKATAGSKGGSSSRGKSSSSKSASSRGKSSSSKSTSSRGKSSSGSKASSSKSSGSKTGRSKANGSKANGSKANGSKSGGSNRSAAGNKAVAKKGGKKSAAVRSGKKATGRRGR